jgi:hypothetical protein
MTDTLPRGEVRPDKRFWPERLQKLTSRDPVIRRVLKDFYRAAKRVVDNDPEGRCVTTDLYVLGLRAATRHKVHHVRVLTAIIDLAWGQRDYARGPIPAPYGLFGTMRLNEYDCLEHFQ